MFVTFTIFSLQLYTRPIVGPILCEKEIGRKRNCSACYYDAGTYPQGFGIDGARPTWGGVTGEPYGIHLNGKWGMGASLSLKEIIKKVIKKNLHENQINLN